MADWNYPRPIPKTADSEQPTGSYTVEPQQGEGANMRSDANWEGKAVNVRRKGIDGILSNKQVQVELTEQAARTIALTLGRLKQTTLTLPADAQELLTALDFVMVGDPASRAAHRDMEAGKGMTPDGGFKEPENFGRAPREIRGTDGRSKL